VIKTGIPRLTAKIRLAQQCTAISAIVDVLSYILCVPNTTAA